MSDEKTIRSEIADKVFYDLPSDKERNQMTPKQLAKLLSECQEKDSPKYILLSHEMNIRIAQVQTKPVYWSIVMTIVGVILGWILSQWQPLRIVGCKLICK